MLSGKKHQNKYPCGHAYSGHLSNLGTLTIGTARLVADLSFFVLCLSPAVGESLIPLNVKTIKPVLLVQQKNKCCFFVTYLATHFVIKGHVIEDLFTKL